MFILAQTTFSLEKFNDFMDIIKSNLEKNIDIKIENTICNATKMRQEETATLSKKVECMIIVGGKNSSNTRKLYDVSKENCVNTFLVEKKDELNLDIIKKFKNIGIMAGASTPNESINEIVKFLYIRWLLLKILYNINIVLETTGIYGLWKEWANIWKITYLDIYL